MRALTDGGDLRVTVAQEVLNSLRIWPLPPATTAANAVSPDAVPPDPSTHSRRRPSARRSCRRPTQITDLFVAWQRNHPDEETRATVEDADALLDTIHHGIAQHSEADVAKY